jgi:modulator of FtsH protease HflK
MSWNNQNNNNNPWGQGPKKPQSPWGGGGGGSPPDPEDMVRQAQDKLKSILPSGDGFGMKSVLMLGLLALVGWSLTGFYVVKNEEVGIETVFGKFTGLKEPGLTYNYPYPVGSVTKPAVTTVNRVEVGTKSTAQRLQTADGLMLTGDENIVDIYFDVQWQVSRAKPENFVFNLQNPEGTIKAVGESAMREVIGKRKIQSILTTDQVAIASEVKTIMQATLDSYGAGVDIRVVQLQRAEPPSQVRDAFLDVAAAQQNQEQLQNQAREYQNGVVPKARGQAQTLIQEAEAYRERLKSEAQGEAARFSRLYDEYKRAPEVMRERLFLENNAKILGRTDKIIMDGGAVNIMPLDQLLKGAAK